MTRDFIPLPMSDPAFPFGPSAGYPALLRHARLEVAQCAATCVRLLEEGL